MNSEDVVEVLGVQEIPNQLCELTYFFIALLLLFNLQFNINVWIKGLKNITEKENVYFKIYTDWSK